MSGKSKSPPQVESFYRASITAATIAAAATLTLHAQEGLRIIPIRGNIYMISGAGGNVTASIGKDGVMLVDSGAPPMTDTLLSVVRALDRQVTASGMPQRSCVGVVHGCTWWNSSNLLAATVAPPAPRPIVGIINTRIDSDHIGGNHITWDSDAVLKLETDAGTQSRRFVFGTAEPAAAPTWQGTSEARWVRPINRAAAANPAQGELRVRTTHMRPGYIRKNGVLYSADAVLTENYVRLVDDDGTQYLALTQMVEDAVYLAQPVIRTMLFRKQADASGWNPTPCAAR